MPVNADFSKLPYSDTNQSKLYTYPLELAVLYQLAMLVFMYVLYWMVSCPALPSFYEWTSIGRVDRA